MNTIIKGGQLHVYFLHNCTLSRCFISNATKLPSSSTRTLITTCSSFYRFCPGEISQYSSSLWYCYDEHWYKINFHISAHSYDTLYVYIWINSIIRICVGEIVGKLWRATMQKKKSDLQIWTIFWFKKRWFSWCWWRFHNLCHFDVFFVQRKSFVHFWA